MNRSTRRSATIVMAILAVTIGAGLLGSAAQAAPQTASGQSGSATLPANPAAKGYLGLCNEAGQNVTGGSIDTKPFVWKAVASTPPPSAYQGAGQNAVLGIFQPRPDTLPIEWGGTSLTAASYYKQRANPAAQATYGDQALRSVIKDYPPEIDGLYVLRMYYGRVNYGTYTTSYPTTTIQVTGSSWRVVKGGTVNCHAATAVSDEQLSGVAGPKSTTPHKPSAADRTVQTAHSRVISVPAAGVGSTTPTGSADGPTGAGTTTHTGTGGSTTVNAAPAADTSRSSSPSWVVWALVGIVALLVLVLGAVSRTRRRGSSGS